MDGNSIILSQILASTIKQEAMLTTMYGIQIQEQAKKDGKSFENVKEEADKVMIRLQNEISIQMARDIAKISPDFAAELIKINDQNSGKNPSAEDK